MEDLKPLHDAVLNGDAKTAKEFTEKSLAAGIEPLALVQQAMMPAMDEVGRRFECNEYFVPELLLSARAMKGALELIRPLLLASGAESSGRVVIGLRRRRNHCPSPQRDQPRGETGRVCVDYGAIGFGQIHIDEYSRLSGPFDEWSLHFGWRRCQPLG